VAHPLTRAAAAVFAWGAMACLAAEPAPGADPTQPPAGFAAGGGAAATSSGPVLQSVILGKGRRAAAIIGGQRVELGGSFGDAILTRVTETQVELRGPAGRQLLRMTPEAVKRASSPAPHLSRRHGAAGDLKKRP
jgi:MSHA biogenesis protein MshK